jgi:hypothetical protein
LRLITSSNLVDGKTIERRGLSSPALKRIFKVDLNGAS